MGGGGVDLEHGAVGGAEEVGAGEGGGGLGGVDEPADAQARRQRTHREAAADREKEFCIASRVRVSSGSCAGSVPTEKLQRR